MWNSKPSGYAIGVITHGGNNLYHSSWQVSHHHKHNLLFQNLFFLI
jgi:hypothetical protein